MICPVCQQEKIIDCVGASDHSVYIYNSKELSIILSLNDRIGYGERIGISTFYNKISGWKTKVHHSKSDTDRIIIYSDNNYHDLNESFILLKRIMLIQSFL